MTYAGLEKQSASPSNQHHKPYLKSAGSRKL